MIKAFDLQQGNLPLLVSIPHPGTLLTPKSPRGSRRGEASGRYHWHIPCSIRPSRIWGASTLCARYSRYVVDINRPADDKPLYSTATTGLLPISFLTAKPCSCRAVRLTRRRRTRY